MSKKASEIRKLFAMARNDPEYAALTVDYLRLEKEFSKMMQSIPEEQQDTAWDFVCTSDQMNWRMMELMCEWFHIQAEA